MSEAPHETPDHRAVVAASIELMQDDLSYPHTLEGLSAAQFYSRHHFHRLFLGSTGLTPGRFLAALRMQRAKELLATTDLSATVISSDVGYSSYGTFTTQFTRLVGVSPGRFSRLVDAVAGSTMDDVSDVPAAPTRDGAVVCDLAVGEEEAALDRCTIVGLFAAGAPQGTPASFGMTQDARAVVARPDQEATGAMLGLSVPREMALTDLLLGRGDVLVGRVPYGPHHQAELGLRSVEPTDPPVLSAAPALHFASMRGALR